MNQRHKRQLLAIIVVVGMCGIALASIPRAQLTDELPPAKQGIEDQYTAEQQAGSDNPAPRDPDAPYPLVTPSPLETGIFEPCDAPFSTQSITEVSCWAGYVNGAETRVYSGREGDDLNPDQGIVVLDTEGAETRFVLTPVVSGPVRITSEHNGVLAVESKTTDYVFLFDTTIGAFTSTNRRPHALCQSLIVPAGASDCRAAASVNNGSFDPDGDAISALQSPPGPYGLGDTAVTLSVTDDKGAVGSCSAIVTVRDTTPPVLTSTVKFSGLWPPSHNLVNVGLTSVATDTCGGSRPVSVSVFGNEDDQTSTGDTTTVVSPDALNIAPDTLRLRGERIATGNGRVYLIASKATDASGNTGIACSTVVVPHDQSAALVASINSQAAAAKTYCQAHNGTPPSGFFVIGDGPVIGSKQ